MGQYFRLINYYKKEYVDPWHLGGGGDIQKEYQTAGHWAGDRISLVGDCDKSRDFDKAEREFANISDQVRRDYNDFIEIKEMKLTSRT